ncbi:hypothetical protein R3P38DRAFT_2773878 [Favolaschia claudopus]|uniref:Uncharacterized protein n=1 Tax=Favolaschia claudopus TaxID=2862362 RepID=A0AAW0BWD3_9AGAR
MTAAPVRLTSFLPADSEDLPWSRQLKVLSSEVDDEQKQEVLSNMNTQRLCFTCLVSQKHFRCVSHFLELLRTSGQREKPSARLVPSIGSSEWRETLFVPATIDTHPNLSVVPGNLDVVTACGQGPAIADFFILAASYAVIAGPEQDENGCLVVWTSGRFFRKYADLGFEVGVGEFPRSHVCGQDKNCPATVRSSDDDGCRFYAFPEWKFTRDEGPPRPTCWSMSGRGCTVGILSGASDVPVLPVFSQEIGEVNWEPDDQWMKAAHEYLASEVGPMPFNDLPDYIHRNRAAAPPVDVQITARDISLVSTVLCDIVSGFLWADPPLQSGSCNGIEYNSFSNLNGGARRRMDVGKNRAFLDRDCWYSGLVSTCRGTKSEELKRTCCKASCIAYRGIQSLTLPESSLPSTADPAKSSESLLARKRQKGFDEWTCACSFGEWHEKSAVSTGVSLDDDARQPASLTGARGSEADSMSRWLACNTKDLKWTAEPARVDISCMSAGTDLSSISNAARRGANMEGRNSKVHNVKRWREGSGIVLEKARTSFASQKS